MRRPSAGLLLSLLLAASSGCTGKDGAPRTLLDGSPAKAPPVELEGVGETMLLTKVRMVSTARREGAPIGSCLREYGWRLPRGPIAVLRIGVESESLTFRERSGRSVFGCDNTPGPREGARRWCGGAYGRIVDGRLVDPRLDVLCTSRAGRPIGFAWVQPAVGVRYVVVRQQGFAEVYERAEGLPVRVSTTRGVDYERARATFEIFEHDRMGRLLRRYELEAVVAG